MAMWRIILLGVAIVAVANGQQRICMQLEAVGGAISNGPERAHLRGVPGKKGIKGDVGPPGIGLKGDPAEVDYERIFAMMNRKFREFERFVEGRMEELEEHINVNLSKVLDGGSIQRLLSHDCPVFYNNRCFRAIIHATKDVNIETSRSLCDRSGEHPANIYDRNHLTMALSLIRENIPLGKSHLHIWTGMQVNTETNSVTLYDGSSAPFVKWRSSSFPDPNEDHIYIHVPRDSSVSDQGFGNEPPTSRRNGVLCEA